MTSLAPYRHSGRKQFSKGTSKCLINKTIFSFLETVASFLHAFKFLQQVHFLASPLHEKETLFKWISWFSLRTERVPGIVGQAE